MKLSSNGRVVKSYDVEVSTPRMVECNEEFRQLGAFLTVVTVGEETNSQPPTSWNDTSFEETEAQEKAVVILAQAEASAQEIIARAQADQERLRQEIIENVRAEVFPVAQAEGYQVGLQAGKMEAQHLVDNANQLIKLAQRAVQEEYTKVDGELLHLAIKIAERLVRSSLAFEPQRIITIIQAITLLPQERLGWRLHVAPDDARLLEDTQPSCPWVIDESLNPGDCFLECQEGIFDAQLEAQLEKIEHTLREELEHGGVESIDSDGRSD